MLAMGIIFREVPPDEAYVPEKSCREFQVEMTEMQYNTVNLRDVLRQSSLMVSAISQERCQFLHSGWKSGITFVRTVPAPMKD